MYIDAVSASDHPDPGNGTQHGSVPGLPSIPAHESDDPEILPSRPADNLDQGLPKSSIWNLPGLDKDTFYAAALYLHVRQGTLDGKPSYREPKTPEPTRQFLDCLADCFARSKLQDARDHVSATAMVTDTHRKRITLYIAKNKSDKGCERPPSEEVCDKHENENKTFADALIGWFNEQVAEDSIPSDFTPKSEIFRTICAFSSSRLENYVNKLCAPAIDKNLLSSRVAIGPNVGGPHVGGQDSWGRWALPWERAKEVLALCSEYQNVKANRKDEFKRLPLLAECAHLAGLVRKEHGFQRFYDDVRSLMADNLKDLAKVLRWINYLGRAYAACCQFQMFCREQPGFTFEYTLLPSQDHEWEGTRYRSKIESWAGDLHLDEIDDAAPRHETLSTQIDKVVKLTADKAHIHCEMQLMMHFAQPGVEKCVDYFGCSKKSCWLCWQMILANSQHSMKGTHRKLYPRWVFPFDFSPSQASIAKGLKGAYDKMLGLVQEVAIEGKRCGPLEAYVQTSARMTPFYQRPQSNEANNATGQSREEALLSANPLAAKYRFPATSFPAIHLPAHPKQPRSIDVQAYNVEAKDRLRYRTAFSLKKYALAFELISEDESTTLEPSLEKCFGTTWLDEPLSYREMIEDDYEKHDFIMWYRSSEALAPNPYMYARWLQLHDEEPLESQFPWRGDVFLLQVLEHPFDPAETLPTFDAQLCLTAVDSMLANRDFDELERKAERDFKLVNLRMETYFLNVRVGR